MSRFQEYVNAVRAYLCADTAGLLDEDEADDKLSNLDRLWLDMTKEERDRAEDALRLI